VSESAGDERFRTERYDYPLPLDLIAQQPAPAREQSRLLVLDGDQLLHERFEDIVRHVQPGDVLVANDTRVLPARFLPKRRGGGKAQVLLLHPVGEAASRPYEAGTTAQMAATTGQDATTTSELPQTWEALVRPGQRVRVGDRLSLTAEAGFEIVGRTPLGTRLVRFYGITASEAMKTFGQAPLPPYIKSPPPDAAERYQTVYATHPGSVAAPTAGFHFTKDLIAAITEHGAEWATLTLDVGAGTFRPVKTADIRDHPMHAERYEIPESTAIAIRRAKSAGGRVIAVGSTTLRSLEDSARRDSNGEVHAGSRWTDLFVYPGFQFRVVDALITNFHLPRTTLLMLVCAFAGTQRVLTAYAEAAKLRYRFYSFGDAMLIAARAPQEPS